MVSLPRHLAKPNAFHRAVENAAKDIVDRCLIAESRAGIIIAALAEFPARQLIVEPSQTKRGADVVALLERARSNSWPPAGNGVQARHHRSGQRGGPHTSKATRAELAGREPWPAPGWLPKYAPERNGIERDWKTLKAHRLAHKTFKNRDEMS
jgi:hypothetical protein